MQSTKSCQECKSRKSLKSTSLKLINLKKDSKMTITIGKKDTLKHVNNLPLKKLSINKNFILNPNKKLINNQLFYKININKRSINYKQK